MGMWTSCWYLVVSFSGSSLSEWMLDLNTWENTGEADEDSPKLIDKLNKHSAMDVNSMVLDTPNP